MMYTWKLRPSRRLHAIIVLIFLVMILFFTFRITSQLFTSEQPLSDAPKFCEKNRLTKHFMAELSAEQLFQQRPIREPFSYQIINGNFCSIYRPDALIFVVSKSSNFDSRNAIRRTWANLRPMKSLKEYSNLRMEVVFLLDIDESLLTRVELEQGIFHDLIQVNLPQYYFLSSYRDMAILHWTETFCSSAQLTIKTDDDVFLNTFLLANVVQTILQNMTQRSENLSKCRFDSSLGQLYGILIRNAQVVRSVKDRITEASRYLVTTDEYPCQFYPNYLSGFGYIVDRFARLQLLCAFLRHEKVFSMSDVYVTGILPEYLELRRIHLGLMISYSSSDDCETFFRAQTSDAYACASSLHYNDQSVNVFERFHAYWQRIEENRPLYLNRQFSRLFRGNFH